MRRRTFFGNSPDSDLRRASRKKTEFSARLRNVTNGDVDLTNEQLIELYRKHSDSVETGLAAERELERRRVREGWSKRHRSLKSRHPNWKER
ncbi:MAG: hypothetical protein PVJ52_02075 [Candidatus Woesebacteria bacterium]